METLFIFKVYFYFYKKLFIFFTSTHGADELGFLHQVISLTDPAGLMLTCARLVPGT